MLCAMVEIPIRIERLSQLFDSLDPSPFREKSLDRNVEAYLLECAEEHHHAVPLQLRLELPADLGDKGSELADAIHAHFRWLHAQAERRSRARGHIHRAALLLGILVLGITLLLRRWLSGWQSDAVEILGEGLLILGWVALWRPAETVLFDTWGHRRQRALLRRLSDVPIKVVASD